MVMAGYLWMMLQGRVRCQPEVRSGVRRKVGKVLQGIPASTMDDQLETLAQPNGQGMACHVLDNFCRS